MHLKLLGLDIGLRQIGQLSVEKYNTTADMKIDDDHNIKVIAGVDLPSSAYGFLK